MKEKIGFLWTLARKYRWLYIGALVSVTLATLAGFLPPLVIGATVDNIIGGNAPGRSGMGAEGHREPGRHVRAGAKSVAMWDRRDPADRRQWIFHIL